MQAIATAFSPAFRNRHPANGPPLLLRLRNNCFRSDDKGLYSGQKEIGSMKLSEQVKPISYLKAHAPEVIRQLADNGSRW